MYNFKEIFYALSFISSLKHYFAEIFKTLRNNNNNNKRALYTYMQSVVIHI